MTITLKLKKNNGNWHLFKVNKFIQSYQSEKAALD